MCLSNRLGADPTTTQARGSVKAAAVRKLEGNGPAVRREGALREKGPAPAALLRDLVRRLDAAVTQSGDQVILQGEVDGVRYTLTRHPEQPPESELPALSSREREIARMIAKGYTNKTIAVVLDISCWTVDTHIRRIFAKVGVRSRSAMVAQLAAAGLVAAADDATPDWQTAWVRHSVDR